MQECASVVVTSDGRETMVGKSILSLLKSISGRQSDPALLKELLVRGASF